MHECGNDLNKFTSSNNRKSTSPSGEKLKTEIAVFTVVSEAPPSKVGSPGGPLASKIFIFVILNLHMTVLNYKYKASIQGKRSNALGM